MALCSENPSRWHGRSILGGGRGCLLWGVTSARKQWCPAGYGMDKRSLPQHEKEKTFLSSPGLSRVHSPSQQPRVPRVWKDVHALWRPQAHLFCPYVQTRLCPEPPFNPVFSSGGVGVFGEGSIQETKGLFLFFWVDWYGCATIDEGKSEAAVNFHWKD